MEVATVQASYKALLNEFNAVKLGQRSTAIIYSEYRMPSMKAIRALRTI